MDETINTTLFVEESQFWKVFHNKYLFNYIINSIPLLSNDHFDITNYYPRTHKTKFKDLLNLDCFFGNKYNIESSMELLKLKIKHNEDFQISTEGLRLLIKECKDVEVLDYFFQRYHEYFIQIDTFQTSTTNKIAFDFFYSKIQNDPKLLYGPLPINQSTIESVLQNAEVYYIEKILSMAPYIDQSIKNFAIKTAFLNKNAHEVVKFLLSNPQYCSL
ncbi:hypothetical protein DICPUDRAFT_42423 [Dictyostelium purpureum]|uniref:Uncharacterized protein n=1 Tax=Dictyostelium purpureum TaxID=5786 RepID=F1A218_DICPU|nr:uncharacterized protein DICPUDRAFT_42423 [Dictyostelium purpureum]EGC29767.1 hypothetical protein DICPUDRAFT_42423 [Dictyostelium purpureum]|eukprot:XP_003293713.1 hypothetical protein DICPUDRAFT_42423 [Dictyostelium purpureum]